MKTVQNQSFWRDLLDQIPETILVFKLDENENAKLIFANKPLISLLGYRPDELVLQSETDPATQTALNALVDTIALASRKELSEDKYLFSIADKWGKSHTFRFKYQLFKTKSSEFPHISVVVHPLDEPLAAPSTPAQTNDSSSLSYIDQVSSPIMKSLLQHLPTVANQHRHIVIAGEKGVGKHSLLKEILRWPSFAERTVVYSMSEVKEAISSPQVFVLDTTQSVNYSSLSEFTFYADRGDIRVLLLIEGTIDTFLARNPEIQSWYYSLGAYVALLPPLSVRKEDRAQYVHQWVEKLADFLGTKVRLTKEFESYLQSHALKENYITLNALLLQSLSTFKHGQLSQPKSVENQAETSRFQVIPFNDMVRKYLSEVLTYTNGKIYGQSGAAYLLKLKPTTLQSKLKKLGLR